MATKTGVEKGVPSIYKVTLAPAALVGPVPATLVAPSDIGAVRVKTPAGAAEDCTGFEFTLLTFPLAFALAVIGVAAAMPPPVAAVKLAAQIPALVTVAVIGVLVPLWLIIAPLRCPAVPPV